MIKKVAEKAKREGKNPKEAAKAAITSITKAGKEAGVKPGPKDAVRVSAKMAAKEGKDPKEAAKKTAQHIVDSAKAVKHGAAPTTATPTVATTTHTPSTQAHARPADNESALPSSAATASTH